MIDFLISKNNQAFTDKNWIKTKLLDNVFLFSGKIDLLRKTQTYKLIIIGDCINIEQIDSSQIQIDYIIHMLKGNFYAFLVQNNKLYITSSAFGLLPVYFIQGFSLISSSVSLIKENTSSSLSENKKWLVNQYLFNFQFGTDTFYEEINLFPCMSYLILDGTSKTFNKYFSIEDAFEEKPVPWRVSMNSLSDLFIKNTKLYIPDSGSVISFTGGFDGRTLVSVATKYNKQFETFSYGKKENDDVFIPQKNARKLGISYSWLDLSKEYSGNEYYGSALNYIYSTNGSNGFLYAHVDYSARKIKQKSDILISGVCGSELFRAVHATGAITSKAIIELFKQDDFKFFKKLVLESYVFKFVDIADYKSSIEEVINEAWRYKNNLNNRLDKNQKLYVFLYEEIFRKFFGAWVKAQMKYINVRTPYIDFDFFKEVIKTELSGAYSDFLTGNPIKRFKGQLLYAEIIRKTNKKLYALKTGKGYAPYIVRVSVLRPFLLIPFLLKRIRRNVITTNLDNLGIISGIKNTVYSKTTRTNFESLNSHDLDRLYKQSEKLDDFSKESMRDTILMAWSNLHYIKSLKD
ncbi:hypothetical protein ACFLTU_10815 [Bacteroidota bacterium]